MEIPTLFSAPADQARLLYTQVLHLVEQAPDEALSACADLEEALRMLVAYDATLRVETQEWDAAAVPMFPDQARTMAQSVTRVRAAIDRVEGALRQRRAAHQ